MVTCFIMGVPARSTNTCRQHQTSMKVPENQNRPPKKMARGSSVDLIAIDQQRFGQACSPVTPLPIENDLTLDWAPGLRCKRLLDYPLAPPSLRIILPRRARVVFSFSLRPRRGLRGEGGVSRLWGCAFSSALRDALEAIGRNILGTSSSLLSSQSRR